MSERPQWLDEFRRRTALIEVIDAAFNEKISDSQVREMLREAAQDLGELFMGSAPATPEGAQRAWPRKRR